MTIQQMLQYVIDKKASDLHLVAGARPLVRIDGELIAIPTESELTENMAMTLLSGVMSPEQKQLFEVNKEMDFSFAFGGLARFRANGYYQKSSIAASFRLIATVIPTIEELGLPKVCHQFATLKQGFVLVTGPTGQGKSTTLAAILDEINSLRQVHIVTIEDPIEFVYKPRKALISQRELHSDTHSWDLALKAVLREDPDVVLIGEMRDYETISAALTIAETGHLVFATLHTGSSVQTIDRIVDVFPDKHQSQIRLMLAENLESVFSQRLLPKKAGGRVVAYEVMIGTTAIKSAIRESRTQMISNIIQTSAEYGMVTLENSLAKLVNCGAVDMEVALTYAENPEELTRLCVVK